MTVCPTPHKAKFRTRRYAKQQGKRARGQGLQRSAGRVHAYLCTCGFFHLGTMPDWMIKLGRPIEDEA